MNVPYKFIANQKSTQSTFGSKLSVFPVLSRKAVVVAKAFENKPTIVSTITIMACLLD